MKIFLQYCWTNRWPHSSMISFYYSIIFIILFMNHIKDSYSYECYVCENQDSNKEKCIKTVKTCDTAESTCMTTVRWGGTPYWDPTGQKQYYVSKQCATPTLCEGARQNSSRRCDRIWFNDWECVECCYGDRCNYFITLGTGSINANFPLMIITSVLAISYWLHLQM